MDTTTSVLGFALPHPFIIGASPLGWDLDAIRRLEDAGCAAIVLPSLFEEQITLEASGHIHHRDPFDPAWATLLADYPSADRYRLGPAEYAEHLSRVRRAVSIPVIASLNGTSAESWLTFSRILEQAGADALELNLYELVTDLHVPSAAIEHETIEIVSQVKHYVKIPIAVKLSPFFAAFANVALQLDEAGADGLVIFNRFYQPDIDTGTMAPIAKADLSTSAELLLRLRWLAILHGRVRPSLVVTGGVSTADDAVKAVLAGADGIEVVSAILRHGPRYLALMRDGLERWMEAHCILRLREVCGRCSLKQAPDPAAFERGNYIRALYSWTEESVRADAKR